MGQPGNVFKAKPDLRFLSIAGLPDLNFKICLPEIMKN